MELPRSPANCDQFGAPRERRPQRNPLQKGPTHFRATAWIAPRRSGVRVPLAPLGEPLQPCGFPEAGARSEAPFGVGLWPDLWPGRRANAPLEFVVLRYFMRFLASISAQSRGTQWNIS